MASLNPVSKEAAVPLLAPGWGEHTEFLTPRAASVLGPGLVGWSPPAHTTDLLFSSSSPLCLLPMWGGDGDWTGSE
jgi:hypothetical protein